MSPRVGDGVHVAGFGTGVVREVRNGGQYLVEIKGRAMVVREEHLSPAASKEKARPSDVGPPPPRERQGSAGSSTLDLHGCTVEEALEALERLLSDALLAGHDEARVIHGRSGGRLKAAVHARLKALPSVRAFRVDPGNEGVTLILF